MSNYYVPTRAILAADLFDGRLAKYGIVEKFVDDLPCKDDEMARALLSPCAALAPSECPEPVDPAWLSYYTGFVGITVYIRRDTGKVREFRRSSLEFAVALFAEFNQCELIDHLEMFPDEIFHDEQALARYNAAITALPANFTAEQLLNAIDEAVRPAAEVEDAGDRMCDRIDIYGEDIDIEEEDIDAEGEDDEHARA